MPVPPQRMRRTWRQSETQNGVFPPVAPYTSPVTNRASFDARNTNNGASSTGWAGLPKAVFAPNFLTVESGIVAGIKGVQTGPGATAFTRTLCFIAICDRAL